MTATAVVMSAVNVLVVVAVLAGLVARRRTRASTALVAYLATIVLVWPPIWFWPREFYVWSYWLATDLLHALLRFVLATELLVLAFGRLPIGRKQALRAAASVILSALLVVAISPTPTSGSSEWIYYQAAAVTSKVTFVGGWLFAALLALSLRYAVPLDPLHRAVAGGLALWTLLQAFPADLAVLDPLLGIGRQGVQRLVYTAMLLAWAREAWRKDEDPLLSPAALRVLRPWRAR